MCVCMYVYVSVVLLLWLLMPPCHSAKLASHLQSSPSVVRSVPASNSVGCQTSESVTIVDEDAVSRSAAEARELFTALLAAQASESQLRMKLSDAESALATLQQDVQQERAQFHEVSVAVCRCVD